MVGGWCLLPNERRWRHGDYKNTPYFIICYSIRKASFNNKKIIAHSVIRAIIL